MATVDNLNSEWRVGDREGKTWEVFRWKDGFVCRAAAAGRVHRVAHGDGDNFKAKRFRSRATAQAEADRRNKQEGFTK